MHRILGSLRNLVTYNKFITVLINNSAVMYRL